MSKPTPPDGSDPRVVTPDPDEPEVEIVGAERSSSQAYHIYPDACDKINRSTTTRTVPKSVAEWQGNDLCDRCAELKARPDIPPAVVAIGHTYDTRLSSDECATLREAVAAGVTAADVSTASGVSKTTVNKHLRGGCTHDVPHPPLTHERGKGWRAADE